MKPLSRIGIALLMAGLAVWTMHVSTSTVAAAKPTAAPQPAKEPGMRPAPVAVPGETSAEVRDLDNQLAALPARPIRLRRARRRRSS
jgi:hypothetical protein